MGGHIHYCIRLSEGYGMEELPPRRGKRRGTLERREPEMGLYV